MLPFPRLCLLLLLWIGFAHSPSRSASTSAAELAPPKAVVIVSANAEWEIVKELYPDAPYQPTPWGETFERTIDGERVVYLHGGWGKVAAAGSAQIRDRSLAPAHPHQPRHLRRLRRSIEEHAIVLVKRTIIYDIKEAMGDSAEAIRDYSIDLDLSWLTGAAPSPVVQSLLVSGDRDLVLADLAARYHAIAGDWESGAIAYTASRNQQRVLLLRGVSDLVSPAGGEAYGNPSAFAEGTAIVMRRLLTELPAWLKRCP